MSITPKNLIRHELIGLRVKIVKSSDPTLINVEGVVVDETKNTLVIRRQNGKEIRVQKDICVFRFMLDDGNAVEVSGEVLVARPEDRIKKRVPKKLWGGLDG